MFSCEICKIFNTFLIQHLRTSASDTKQTSTVATTEFLSKSPNRKKIFNEHFNLCEAKISLDEITKYKNSETNNKSPGNDDLTAEFHKHFSNELAPALLDVYDSWVLLLEQESYRSNIKNVIKKILQTTNPCTTILKNRLQKTFKLFLQHRHRELCH